MKKILKKLGWVVLSFVIILLFIAAYIGLSPIPSYDIQKINYQVQSSPEAVMRGEKLAMMLCANCHLNRETRRFTGQKMRDLPTNFGVAYAQNITQDKEAGIGNWTDGELKFLLRTGIKKDGQYAPPYMPKLPNMADEDLNAIIAFLRSDRPVVQADSHKDRPCEPSFFTKFLSRVAFKPFPYPNKNIPMPDSTNELEVGKYLAHNLDCYACHSADFATNDYLDPPKSPGYFGGGNQPLNLKGEVVPTMNLTPDKETGIGLWSKETFIQALKYGQKENEPGLRYPMIPYTMLTDYEAGAIYEYLQTIPAIKNEVKRAKFE